jgi:hypothetical protein
MKKISMVTFDKEVREWCDNREYNIMFLRYNENYINDLIRARGYVYLNQIYELLGIKWDPKCENICIEWRDGLPIFVEFETFVMSDESILIHICHHGELESK